MNLTDILDNNLFIFDLDRTIWDCYDKYNNPIWAKQMLTPFDNSLYVNAITDDVGSRCELHDGIRDVVRFLHGQNKWIGFVSSGGIKDTIIHFQPSYRLLKKFGVYDDYKDRMFLKLAYKTFSKKEYFQNYHIGSRIVFFDDDPKVLKEVSEVPNVTCIDRMSFWKWDSLL